MKKLLTHVFLIIPLLVLTFALPALADETDYVWVHILVVNGEGQSYDVVIDEDCKKQTREKTSVYVEGLKPESNPHLVLVREDRSSPTDRACWDTLPITINGETLAWPVDAHNARRKRFGIKKTEPTVHIIMPETLTIREHGMIAQRSIGPIEMPAKATINQVTIPMERFPENQPVENIGLMSLVTVMFHYGITTSGEPTAGKSP